MAARAQITATGAAAGLMSVFSDDRPGSVLTQFSAPHPAGLIVRQPAEDHERWSDHGGRKTSRMHDA